MITKESIVILDKVNFETGSAIIEPRSFAVLNQVADVMKKKSHASKRFKSKVTPMTGVRMQPIKSCHRIVPTR